MSHPNSIPTNTKTRDPCIRHPFSCPHFPAPHTRGLTAIGSPDL